MLLANQRPPELLGQLDFVFNNQNLTHGSSIVPQSPTGVQSLTGPADFRDQRYKLTAKWHIDKGSSEERSMARRRFESQFDPDDLARITHRGLKPTGKKEQPTVTQQSMESLKTVARNQAKAEGSPARF